MTIYIRNKSLLKIMKYYSNYSIIMKYLQYRNTMDNEFFPYLRYSAYLLLIPTMFYLYYKQYGFFLMLFIFSITSILRWSYVKNKLYQVLDHNYVKIVFMIALYSAIISATKCVMTSLLILGSMMNIVYFYCIGLYYDYYQNKKNVIFHMIVHLHTAFGFYLGSNHLMFFLEK